MEKDPRVMVHSCESKAEAKKGNRDVDTMLVTRSYLIPKHITHLVMGSYTMFCDFCGEADISAPFIGTKATEWQLAKSRSG
jgi:hypothetical protein